MPAVQSERVTVLGAGIVGVSCALELQRLGFAVSLVDRREPGEETSFGNAGVLSRSSIVPLNNPALWPALFGLLRGRSASLRVSAREVLRNAGWCAGFLAQATPERTRRTAAALDGLIRRSIETHRDWLALAGVAHRLRETGWLIVYRSDAAFDAQAPVRALLASHGVAADVLDPGRIAALEPHLTPCFARGVWVRDAASVDDPEAVVKAYAALFRERGGRFQKREIGAIESAGAGLWQAVDSQGRRLPPSQVVVALGPWSPKLLTGLGMRVRMGFERGYHMHFAVHGSARLSRPVYDAGGGYVLSPMARGYRLTTGVEIASLESPPNPVPLEAAEAAARQAFPLGDRLDREAWMGARPTLPDSRPAIGAAPDRPGLWFAFGHQHIGFSTGPGSARLLGALMRSIPQTLDGLDGAPFDPRRLFH